MDENHLRVTFRRPVRRKTVWGRPDPRTADQIASLLRAALAVTVLLTVLVGGR